MKKKILICSLSVVLVASLIIGLVWFLGDNETLTVFLNGMEVKVSATSLEDNSPLISAEEIFDVADVEYSYENGKAYAKGKNTLEIDTDSNSIKVNGLIQQSEFLIDDDKLMISPYLAGEVMNYETISTENEVRFIKPRYVKIKFRDSGKSLSLPYCDDFFLLPSTEYNHSLANLSLGLAASAFSSKESDAYYGDTGNFGRDKDIIAVYKELGFSNIKTFNYDKSLNDTSDTVAYAMAEKNITNNGEKYRLVALSVRGGCYGNEWVSNFNIGNTEIHKGFLLASDEVVKNLYEYIGNKTSNTKLWMTGFSRGGGVAGITAARITDEGKLPSENIYAYTFATPAGTTAKNAKTEKYGHIFNIISENDLIPLIAPEKWGYTRYGTDLTLPSLLNYSNDVALAESQKISSLYKSIITSGDFKLYDIEKSGQKQDIRTFINNLSSALGSRISYTDKYANIIMDYIECSNTKIKDENGNWVYGSMEDILTLKYPDAPSYFQKIKENPLLKNASALLGNAGKNIVAFGVICMVNGESPIHVINEIGIENLVSFASLFSLSGDSNIAKCHYPESYTAQLNSFIDPYLILQ
ncbi:MAG: hypothetical protein E7415_02375 [Ruminococcaceae bacterium]|nr:hypothetical protein [Oscillospiraceae bacterium]